MPRAATLAFIKPCLAQDASTPPSGEQWVHEIKFDGILVQALVAPPNVSLLTRNGLDWTHRLGLRRGDSRSSKFEVPTSAAVDQAVELFEIVPRVPKPKP
jgi:ATP-dependent DNA ligase